MENTACVSDDRLSLWWPGSRWGTVLWALILGWVLASGLPAGFGGGLATVALAYGVLVAVRWGIVFKWRGAETNTSRTRRLHSHFCDLCFAAAIPCVWTAISSAYASCQARDGLWEARLAIADNTSKIYVMDDWLWSVSSAIDRFFYGPAPDEGGLTADGLRKRNAQIEAYAQGLQSSMVDLGRRRNYAIVLSLLFVGAGVLAVALSNRNTAVPQLAATEESPRGS